MPRRLSIKTEKSKKSGDDGHRLAVLRSTAGLQDIDALDESEVGSESRPSCHWLREQSLLSQIKLRIDRRADHPRPDLRSL